MVKIVTDSTCDLTLDLVKENDILVLPLYVNFDEESFRDGVDINTEKLYEEVDKRKKLPKTAAVTINDFIEAFTDLVNQGYEVIYTGISGSMSSSYNNAILAAKEVDESKIFVVDSKNLSTGISLTVLKACSDRDKGLSAKEIAENMKKNVDLVRAQFAIETMEYLHKGGRCTGIQRIIGTVLKLKPIIYVREGKMSVGQKPMGKMKVALDRMVDLIVKDKDNLDLDRIFITHSISPESAAYLNQRLKELFPNVLIIETVAGCVISSHCGKGTIGILYMLKS